MMNCRIYRKQYPLCKDGWGSRLKPWILKLFLIVCTVIIFELCLSVRYLSLTSGTYIRSFGFNFWKNDRPIWRSRDPTQNFSLVDDFELQYATNYVTVNDYVCFRNGLPSVTNSNVTSTGCQCKQEWHGPACSIPSQVFHSTTPWNMSDITLRVRPRRIVQAFPFNMEFEMLELRFAELASVVDVFLILESNYTAFGEQKPLYLLDRLKSGMYADVVEKIVHVMLGYFPPAARKNGWIADGLHRDFIGTDGLRKISGLNSSDIFILTDADELPSNDILMFLKWHDGYTEPVSISYQWNVFGFFWTPGRDENCDTIPQTQQISAVATIGMVRYVFRNLVYGIRSAGRVIDREQSLVQIYSTKLGGRVSQWTIGNATVTAGWHCSWCMSANRIRNKLLSAQNGDFPRWGDYPNKTKVSFIRRLIAKGMWFDEKTAFREMNSSGPDYLLTNNLQFRHITYNDHRQQGEYL